MDQLMFAHSGSVFKPGQNLRTNGWISGVREVSDSGFPIRILALIFVKHSFIVDSRGTESRG